MVQYLLKIASIQHFTRYSKTSVLYITGNIYKSFVRAQKKIKNRISLVCEIQQSLYPKIAIYKILPKSSRNSWIKKKKQKNNRNAIVSRVSPNDGNNVQHWLNSTLLRPMSYNSNLLYRVKTTLLGLDFILGGTKNQTVLGLVTRENGKQQNCYLSSSTRFDYL